ncbi:MAG: hypothetical protein WKF59_06590 [Chitinophagaceae bacterium]
MSNTLSNIELVNIAEKFGTPLYVYDAEKIKDQYNKLTTAFKNIDSAFFMLVKRLPI